MTLRLPPPLTHRLREVAVNEHLSMHTLAVEAVAEFLERHDQQYVRQLAQNLADQDTEILDELAK